MKTILSLKQGAYSVAILAAMAVTPAWADPPTGNANAYDLSIHIDLLGVTQLDVAAQTTAQVTNAVASVDDAHQLNSLDVTDPLSLVHLHTGLLTSEAAYAGGNLAAVGAQSTVDDLALSAVGIASNGILSILANTVVSRSVLAGSCSPAPPRPKTLLDDFVFFSGFDTGNLQTVGDGGGDGGGGRGGLPGSGALLDNLQIEILGTMVPVPLDPAPNTTIDLADLGIAGATLILNERSTSGDGVHDLSMSSNAIHLTLDVAGAVTAEVVIAHSDASLQCL